MRLDFEVNFPYDKGSVMNIAVNGQELSSRENSFEITESGDYKIKISVEGKRKIRNKFHTNFKELLIPYYGYYHPTDIDFIVCWDNQINCVVFEFDIHIGEANLQSEKMVLNIGFTDESVKNYCNTNDYFYSPTVQASQKADISDIRLCKNETLQLCSYKQNQVLLRSIRFLITCAIACLYWIFTLNYRSQVFNNVVTIALLIIAVYSFTTHLYKLNKRVKTA